MKKGLFKAMSGILAAFVTVSLAAGVFVFMAQNVYAKDSDGNIVIVIDPGHGGYDGGASSILGDKESELNWQIAKYMKAELETYSGVKVYITRGKNEWHTNTGRGHFGIQIGADFQISIHNNSSGNAGTNGYVAYGSVRGETAEATKNMCLNLDRYAQAAGLSLFSGGYLTRSSTNDPNMDYYTFIDEGNRSGIPSIIVEHTFLTNQSDATYIRDLYNQQKIGYANATAVAEYYGLSKRQITDGQTLNLERSYSAYFVPASAKGEVPSYTSSDSNIAYVRSDGLITAVSEGSATVTYIYSDGTSGSCQINVNPVRMIGISAGINPTVYRDSASIAAIDTNTLMVKAIYSDGSAKQIFDYSVAAIDPNMQGRQYIPVSAYGFTSNLMINYDVNAEAGTYSSYLYQPNGPEEDIFTLPPNTSLSDVSGSPATNPGFTVVQPVETTVAETKTAETTVAETTTTETSTTVETTAVETNTEATSAEQNVVETAKETTTEVEKTTFSDLTISASETVTTKNEADSDKNLGNSKDDKIKDNKIDWIVVTLVAIIAVLIAILVFAIRSLTNGSPKRKKRR